MQRRLITVNIHENAIYLYVYTDYFTTPVENVCLRHVFTL